MKIPAPDPVALLRQRIARAGSHKAVAMEFGISMPYLSNVLAGRKAAGPKILAGLGLRRDVRLVKELAKEAV